jgi:hypothetical protein
MTLVDRKTLTRAWRTRGGAHPRRQPAPGTRDLEGTGARDPEGTGARGAVAAPAGRPEGQARQATRGEPKPEPTGDNGVPPSGPQRPAPPITKQTPIGPPGVAGKMGQPAPERELPAFGWLVLIGAIFVLAVVKESLGRTAGPVVVKAKSAPRPPASFLIAALLGTLARIGARIVGR